MTLRFLVLCSVLSLLGCSRMHGVSDMLKPIEPPRAYAFQASPQEPTARLRIVSNQFVFGGTSLESCPLSLAAMVTPKRMLDGRDVTTSAWRFPAHETPSLGMLPRLAGPLPTLDEAVRNSHGQYAERVAEFLVPAGRSFVLRSNAMGVDVVGVMAQVCAAQTHRFVFEPGGQYEARIGMDGQRCDFHVYDLNRGPESARWTQMAAVQSPVRGCR